MGLLEVDINSPSLTPACDRVEAESDQGKDDEASTTKKKKPSPEAEMGNCYLKKKSITNFITNYFYAK